jgi:hypothetical protein
MKKIFPLFFTTMILISSVKTANAQTATITEGPKTTTKSSIATLYKNLGTYLKTTDAQNQKAIPILTEYDANVDAIKAKNAGNSQKIQQETNALNTKTIESLKKVLNGEQVLKLLVAISANDNIVNGKNLDANQKAFVTKAKNQYKLNDTQLTSVALVLVQAKLVGDAIAVKAKSNPQGAQQDLQKLLSDLDGQLKASLSDEQYKNVKADIEKIAKGQKI